MPKSWRKGQRKSNQYELHEDHAIMIIDSKKYGRKLVKLTLEDVEMCELLTWSVMKCQHTPSGTVRWYAKANVRRINGTRAVVFLHNYLYGWTEADIDHVSGDGLDCRRRNLRQATRGENSANSRKRNGCSSAYKGVTWHRDNRRWYAQIKVNGSHRSLGYFSDETEAALAYDTAARLHFGEFARTNFPLVAATV